MRITVIDDDVYWRDYISKECEKILMENTQDFLIECYPNGECLFTDTAYDIIFLDIEMDMENGLEIAKRYRAHHRDTIIIFVTSHVEFSRKGYMVDAFRYIVKENLKEELDEAIHAILKKREQVHPITFHIIHFGSRTIQMNDIYYIETEKRNIRVHLEKESFLASDRITEISETLLQYHFYRTHKSYLVNMNWIHSFDYENIYFTNREKAMLSTRNYSDFKKTFFEYKIEMANK